MMPSIPAMIAFNKIFPKYPHFYLKDGKRVSVVTALFTHKMLGKIDEIRQKSLDMGDTSFYVSSDIAQYYHGLEQITGRFNINTGEYLEVP